MSLDQAYALFDERRKANPLNRGLAAGLQAYENPEIPRRSGIGPIDQATLKSSVQQAIDRTTQQQQQMQNIAAKQALGLYTPTGTSGAAYNYLMGRGQYPRNPVLAGQPGSVLKSPTVSTPYEDATKVGSPTQSETSKAAANAPSKMPSVNYGPAGMPKPSLMSNLIGTLGPGYLAYSLADKLGGIDALKNLYGAGITYWNTPSLLADAQAAQDAAFIPYAGGKVLDISPLETAPVSAVDPNSVQAILDNAGPGVLVADASGALPSSISAAAPVIDEAAMASAADIGAANAGTAAADYAAALPAIDPITGALVLAAATPIGQNIIKGAGDIVGGAVQSVGDAASDIVQSGGDFISSVFGGGGGCFLTTAAVDHAREKDDGHTLTAMRDLRDDYLRKFPEGRKEIEWYYRKAPKIVDAIDKKPNAHAIYMRMYNDHIKPTAKAVEQGNYEVAHQRYNKLIGFAKKVSGLSTKELELNTKHGIPKDIEKNFATGGVAGLSQTSNLGDYSDGGRLLKGPGDGVSDSIPATIGGKQPARLADGEFVVPARIVSELGNGSTSAGAKKLYAMMDRIQTGRKKSIGKGKVAVNSRADKYLPA